MSFNSVEQLTCQVCLANSTALALESCTGPHSIAISDMILKDDLLLRSDWCSYSTCSYARHPPCCLHAAAQIPDMRGMHNPLRIRFRFRCAKVTIGAQWCQPYLHHRAVDDKHALLLTATDLCARHWSWAFFGPHGCTLGWRCRCSGIGASSSEVP